jgi:hypothetical protein
LIPLAAVAVGALIGFFGSRQLRRPQHAAQAASVARTVGASVGRRKTLTAPELQRACFSEMVRHVRVDRKGRTRAPARYTIQVAPVDMEVIEDTKSWFTDGLRDALTTAAHDNGWTIDGTVAIRFEVDASRRAGVPNALAVDPEGPKRADPTGPPGTAIGRGLALVRTDTGARTRLGSDPVTIGRSSERSIVIDDTRVSRSHATVARARSGWSITDNGSSNGTRLNGRAITAKTAKALSAGDVIGIGPVELRVEADAGQAAGARALDDSDRTRISGEVLPKRQGPTS